MDTIVDAGGRRRRSWSVDEKRRMVEESLDPGASPASYPRGPPALVVLTDRLSEMLWGERRGQGTIVAVTTDGVPHATVE